MSYKKYGWSGQPTSSREEDCEGQDGNGVCDTSNAKAKSSQELSQRELRSDSRGASEGSGDAATASGCHHGTDHDPGSGPARAELPGHAGDPGLLGDGTAESSTSSSCRANAVATDTSSSRSEVGAPARSGYRDDQPESRSGPGLVPCLATLSMSSLGEQFVSPSSTGERASWLVSPLRSSSFNCFSMVNPSDVYVCQGEGDSRLSVVWRDRQLIQDLIMGDANDDHEFHIPKSKKRSIANSVQANFSNQPQHFAEDSCGRALSSQHYKHECGRDARTQEKFQKSGEDAKTSRKISRVGEDGRTSKVKKYRGEDASTSRAPGPTHMSGSTQNPIGCSVSKLLERNVDGDAIPESNGVWECLQGTPQSKSPSLQRLSALASSTSASSHGKRNFKLCELFSPRRVTLVAQEKGMETTSIPALDRLEGWDFNCARDRAEFWRILRDEKPDLVLMSPECKAFFIMMSSNWQRMSPEEQKRVQAEGLAMLHFCVLVAQFQLDHGRYFLFEHPASATSWASHMLHWLLQQQTVFRIVFDQCMAGLSVQEGTVSQKPTAIASNHLGILVFLSEFQCDHQHEHLHLQGSLTDRAKVYPPQVVNAIISGISWQLQQRTSIPSFAEGMEEVVVESDDLEEDLDAEIDDNHISSSLRSSPQPSKELTKEQKDKIFKVHVNQGHLPKHQLLLLFKAANAKPEVLQYIKDKFHCEQCMKRQHPVPRRKAAFPRTFAFNRLLGI